jgi:hypothetical protein
MEQWRVCVIGGEVNWDLRRPADFERVGSAVTAEHLRRSIPITDSTALLEDWLGTLSELGVDTVYLHQVGRNQREFIEAYSKRLPTPQTAAAAASN